MKIVYNWLKEFVEVAATPEELASRLALAGTNIGGVEKGPHGAVIDAEVTSNRPDCLSHLGMAREVGAIYRTPVIFTAMKPAEAAMKASDAVKVEIQSPELCGRYTARVIRGAKIQPSPKWLKERLEASGVASINNVVDVTNYVMLEMGNPLHAFDYDKIRDHSIVVRKAKPGEKMRTLDGVERALDPHMCMVCDGDGSRAIGSGVMGGAETEISFSTRNVLLECAWFDPISIRRAARSLKLHTEASTRFGRGADMEMAEVASRRSAELILQLAGGELLAGVVDVYPAKRRAKRLRVTRAELLRVMGADVPDKEVEAILSALGFAPVRVDENRGAEGSILAAWECTQPSWRADVEREIDLIEEVARIYGLDKFSPRLPAARQGAARLPHYEAEARLRERLMGLGYQEILTIPHVAEERDRLFRRESLAPARLANPLSEEAGVLRSTGLVTMVAAIEWNLNHGQRHVRLFEIGRRYENARVYDFADLKGDLDSIGELAGGLRWEQGGADFLHAAKRAKVFLGDGETGQAGQLAKRVAERLKLRQDVYLAELSIAPVYEMYYATKNARRYEALPRFPGVERDFSLLLDDGTHFSDVTKTIESLGIREITSVEATDLFRGKNVPSGKYSLLVRVIFQSRETTLTEGQISGFSARVVSALETRLGAQLRAS